MYWYLCANPEHLRARKTRRIQPNGARVGSRAFAQSIDSQVWVSLCAQVGNDAGEDHVATVFLGSRRIDPVLRLELDRLSDA